MSTIDSAALRGQPLTPNEIAILTGVSFGLTDRQIGTQLLVTENTVKYHLKKIAAKMGTRSRAHMVRLGFVEGYLLTSQDGAR